MVLFEAVKKSRMVLMAGKIANLRHEAFAFKQVAGGVSVALGAGAHQRKGDHGAQSERGGKRVTGRKRIRQRGQGLVIFAVKPVALLQNHLGGMVQRGPVAQEMQRHFRRFKPQHIIQRPLLGLEIVKIR